MKSRRQKLLPKYSLAVLADTCNRNGLYEKGQRYLQEARENADKSGQNWWLAEIYRLEGNAYPSTDDGDPKRAQESFQKAQDISRRQQAKILELRAASDMSRLMQMRGDRQQAYDLLVLVYQWFTEGLETDDLRAAGKLLDELS